MDMKMNREFVHVIHGAAKTTKDSGLYGICGCQITEHADTVTVVCETMNGLALLINLCTTNQGEKKINSIFRSLGKAIIEFIG